jgi:hypothetical protein
MPENKENYQQNERGEFSESNSKGYGTSSRQSERPDYNPPGQESSSESSSSNDTNSSSSNNDKK